jgi:hypothetical protein
MPFKKGQSGNPKGRDVGTQNRITKTVKEAFEIAFNDMQSVPGVRLGDWGKENPTEFYKISSKLIPSDVNATITTQESALELLKRGLGLSAKVDE